MDGNLSTVVSPPQAVSCPVPPCSPAMADGNCPSSLREQRALQGSCWSYLPGAKSSFSTCLCRLSHSPGILPRICMRLCHLDWKGSCREKGQRLFVEKHITPTPIWPAIPPPPHYHPRRPSEVLSKGSRRKSLPSLATGMGEGLPVSERYLCVRGCALHMTSCHLHNIQ